jgi:hypothetical protein
VGRGSTGRGIRNLAKVANSIGFSTGSDGIYSSGTLDNCHGSTSGGYGGYIEGGTAKNCTFSSSSSFGAGVINATTLMECSFFSSASYGLYAQAAIIALNCSAYSTASHAMFVFNAASRLENCTGYSTANNGMRIEGTTDLFNCTAHSTAAAALHTSYRVQGCSIICEWNNASGHGITGDTTAYTEVFNNYIRVTHASANCLHYGSAITVYHGINSFKGATTSVNANITQGQAANVMDAYGNIKIG